MLLSLVEFVLFHETSGGMKDTLLNPRYEGYRNERKVSRYISFVQGITLNFSFISFRNTQNDEETCGNKSGKLW